MVSGDACRAWRGELARRALGRADPDADPGLDAHLDGCADCRSELEDLRAAADAAGRADPDRLPASAIAPGLADRIVERVAREAAATRQRRRHRLLVAAAAGVAAVVAAVALVLTFTGDDAAEALRVELTGTAEIDGSAVLVGKRWGTAVMLEVSGLDEGDVYWLWLTDADDNRFVAGSFTGTGGPARVTLASALPADEARRIWMTDEADHVVLDAEISR
jgi:hypothetical protein